jgi:hypothetical protein
LLTAQGHFAKRRNEGRNPAYTSCWLGVPSAQRRHLFLIYTKPFWGLTATLSFSRIFLGQAVIYVALNPCYLWMSVGTSVACWLNPCRLEYHLYQKDTIK